MPDFEGVLPLALVAFLWWMAVRYWRCVWWTVTNEPALLLMHACVAADRLGLPGMRWLERLARQLARKGRLSAGTACGIGYNALVGDADGRERGWLDRLTPVLVASGPNTVERAYQLMTRGKQSPQVIRRWLTETLREVPPRELSPLAAHNLAYCLYTRGDAAAALPYARAALRPQAETVAPLFQCFFHGTLGLVLAALDDLAGAEDHLRESIRRAEWLGVGSQTGARLMLARVLADGERYAEALDEAERALREHRGEWNADWPGRSKVDAWLAQWRDHACWEPDKSA